MKRLLYLQHVQIHYLVQLTAVLAPEHALVDKITTAEQKEAVEAIFRKSIT